MWSRTVTWCSFASTYRSLAPAGLAGLALLAPLRLEAQSAIAGVVVDDSTGAPVPDVEVVLQAVNLRQTTDSAGRFVLGNLPPGLHLALVRKIGYRPVQLRAILVAEDTLNVTVQLQAAAVELAPIEVTASAIPPGMDAFEERRRRGEGQFIDWKVLRRSEHRQLSDVLRTVPGVAFRYGRGNQVILLSSRERCPMQIYLDGVKIFEPRRGGGRAIEPPDLNQFGVTQLEGIEVYAGPAQTPSQLGGTGGQCGTVVLWSRRR